MQDDFRVTFRVDGEGLLGEMLERLHTGEAGREASERLGDRVVVSHDEDHLFLYAGSEDDARLAAATVRPIVGNHRLHVVSERLERWHPDAGRWENAALPLPENEADREAEHERLMARELDESRRLGGVPQWEVRVRLDSQEEAERYAEQLSGEGLHVVRRAEYVLAGANTEDEGHALADRLRASAPAGARFEVEGNGTAIWSTLHPFAIFGGLGQ